MTHHIMIYHNKKSFLREIFDWELLFQLEGFITLCSICFCHLLFFFTFPILSPNYSHIYLSIQKSRKLLRGRGVIMNGFYIQLVLIVLRHQKPTQLQKTAENSIQNSHDGIK